MRLCVLGSGSKGQAVYVEAGDTRVLFDAGFSARELKRRLGLIDVDVADLDAVVISHEHSDHVAGLRVMGRQFPVWATAGTLSQVGRRHEIVDPKTIEAGASYEIGAVSFTTLPLSHDAAEPVGFVIEDECSRAAIVTDLGVATRAIVHRLEDLDLVMIEANHDAQMLIDGTYPWELKQRIKSRHGHLSNQQSAELLAKIMSPRLKNVLLAHLSEANNLPRIALGEAESAVNGSSCVIEVCSQGQPSDVFELG